MRHHQHKGLYIALKLGGAAVATAAAATSYVYLKRQNELKAQAEEASKQEHVQMKQAAHNRARGYSFERDQS